MCKCSSEKQVQREKHCGSWVNGYRGRCFSSNLRFFFLVVTSLKQRCAPLLKLHISHCSTSLIMCTVSSVALVCIVFTVFVWYYCQILCGPLLALPVAPNDTPYVHCVQRSTCLHSVYSICLILLPDTVWPFTGTSCSPSDTPYDKTLRVPRSLNLCAQDILYLSFFSASFYFTFLSDGIAISVTGHVFFVHWS